MKEWLSKEVSPRLKPLGVAFGTLGLLAGSIGIVAVSAFSIILSDRMQKMGKR